MPNFNKVIIAGHLCRDPDLKYTPKGTAVAKIGLAINRSWKTETGESKQEVTFVDVDAFGKSAEVIAQYLRKGRPLLIEGRLKLDEWTDKQSGQKRTRLGVVLESFQFMDSKADDATAAAPAQRPAAAPPAAAQPTPAATTSTPAEDDVPF